jgi:hypothetical protein
MQNVNLFISIYGVSQRMLDAFQFYLHCAHVRAACDAKGGGGIFQVDERKQVHSKHISQESTAPPQPITLR